MCSVCNWLKEGLEHGWEVEHCEKCGHYYSPYIDDCACGIHHLPNQEEPLWYFEEWEHKHFS